MPPRYRRQKPIWSSLAPLALIAAAVGTVSTAQPSIADPRPARPAADASYAWSPSQVRELIAAIEESNGYGLDPRDYGIAALRAQLDLCDNLWNTPGSRQMDALARAAALALANEYRRRAAAGPVRPAELDAALVAGRVRPWLAAQAQRRVG